jgi:hypothetical protein
MKNIPFLGVILISLTLVCCGMKAEFTAPPIATFTSPFPKRNVNLASVLGTDLKLRSDGDTPHLTITSSKGVNVIVESITLDTIFCGRVSRFRDLYFFTTQINDSSYWLYAVKISGNLVYGIRSGWTQMYAVDDYVMQGKYPQIVEYFKPDTSIIRLRPDKRALRKMFNSILTTESPDTILNADQVLFASADTVESIAEPAPEFESNLKVYPNPATSFIDLELTQPGYSSFVLSDLNGETHLHGKLESGHTRIDVSHEKAGLYLLSIKGEGYEKQLRIVKQ